MNLHDQSNLKFLMSLTKRELKTWFNSVTKDDVEYALEILKLAQVEEIIEINTTEVSDFTDAKKILSRFTIKGIA